MQLEYRVKTLEAQLGAITVRIEELESGESGRSFKPLEKNELTPGSALVYGIGLVARASVALVARGVDKLVKVMEKVRKEKLNQPK